MAVDATPTGGVSGLFILPLCGRLAVAQHARGRQSLDTPQFAWFLRGVPFALSHGQSALLTPEGYIYGPTSISPRPSAVQESLVQIQRTGDGALTAASRMLLCEDLRRWWVETVIVGPMPHNQEMVAFLTALLERDPLVTGGVEVWWHVDSQGGA